MKRDVADLDNKIADLNLEEAGRAKRQFEAKWADVKERETKLLNAVSLVYLSTDCARATVSSVVFGSWRGNYFDGEANDYVERRSGRIQGYHQTIY